MSLKEKAVSWWDQKKEETIEWVRRLVREELSKQKPQRDPALKILLAHYELLRRSQLEYDKMNEVIRKHDSDVTAYVNDPEYIKYRDAGIALSTEAYDVLKQLSKYQ